jgi:hypothetical protein
MSLNFVLNIKWLNEAKLKKIFLFFFKKCEKGRQTKKQVEKMTIHLRKLAARIEDIEELESIQFRKLQDYGNLFTHTRNTPKRKDELLNGGSLYWVIKGHFRVRQEIIGFEEEMDNEGRKYCLIMLKPGLIKTELKQQKAFQGWRYFEDSDLPKDIGDREIGGDELPEDMQTELRDLGLL